MRDHWNMLFYITKLYPDVEVVKRAKSYLDALNTAGGSDIMKNEIDSWFSTNFMSHVIKEVERNLKVIEHIEQLLFPQIVKNRWESIVKSVLHDFLLDTIIVKSMDYLEPKQNLYIINYSDLIPILEDITSAHKNLFINTCWTILVDYKYNVHYRTKDTWLTKYAQDSMTTNEVAEFLDRHPQTIGKYERMFGLKIPKDVNGNKIFSIEHVERLKEIKKELEGKDPRMQGVV